MLFLVVGLVLLALVALAVYFRSRRKPVIAFFHPNCMDCGGGEKVLWAAVDAIKNENLAIFAENANYEDAKKKLRDRFQMDIPEKLEFVNVGPAEFLRPNKFPRFTLILQALSSLVYAVRCLCKMVPAVVIDTTGAPFAVLVWKLLGGCKVVLYIHYPFISTDMLSDVEHRRNSMNNKGDIATSTLKTRIKVLYYRALCALYAVTGKFTSCNMVNSTWTSNHIETIYGSKPITVYPPCDCTQFCEFPIEGREKGLIVSVGQFRPEKNYPLQLDIMEQLKATDKKDAKLVIVGGVRNEGDQKLFDALQERIEKQKLNVELKPNLPYADLKHLLRTADVGLHTMRNEHFGICVVEYMAAGLIPLSNKSAGPWLDIVKDENYLAETLEEYVQKLQVCLEDTDQTRIRFREQSKRFSFENFQTAFKAAIQPYLH